MRKAQAPRPGFYGKVPTHGDFVGRGLARSVRAAFDGWLSRSIAASRTQLGDRWVKIYLVAPIWRFVIGSHVLAPHPVAGVMMPSVDRVGRYFPLVLAVEMPACNNAERLLRVEDRWFAAAERLALTSLDEPFDLDAFDAEVEALSAPSYENRVAYRRRARRFVTQGIASESAVADDEPWAITARRNEATDEPFSMWSTRGSDIVSPALLTHPGFPAPEQFAAFLDGHWQMWGWSDARSRPVAPDAGRAHHRMAGFASAARTHAGTRRSRNEDAFLERPALGLWAVADGVGGHADGAVASAVVVDKLATMMAPVSFGSALSEVNEILDEANDALRDRARRLGPAQIVAAVVVVLLVHGDRFALVWAGDSRGYILRQGTLARLTDDHRGEEGDHSVSTAVGAADVLLSDIVYGRVEAGDRFLLCSDGLNACVRDDHIGATARRGTPAQVASQLVDDALVGGARDNVTVIVIDAPKDLA